MFIKITSTESGLVVGQAYNLCEMSARTLIGKGQAKEITSKGEIRAAKKEEAKRWADKKVARLAGNLTAAAEKATKAAKDAVAAVEAAKKAQAEAAAAVKDAEAEIAEATTGPGGDTDSTENDDDGYTGDFCEFIDDQIAEFAIAAKLPANITNPATIIKHLIAAGFDPRDKDQETDGDE